MKPVGKHHPINVHKMSTLANAKRAKASNADKLREALGHGTMADKFCSIKNAIRQIPELRESGVYYVRL